MNARYIIGKLSVLAAIMMVLVVFQPKTASAVEPVFEIRAKDGHTIVDAPFQRLSGAMDAENYVRMGIELRRGIRIGFDSKHGFGLVLDF